MLTKRTNILFDDDLWKLLILASKKEKLSVGEIVRNAIRDKYSDEEIIKLRSSVCKKIMKFRPKPFKGKIDYKELINYGRKY